LAAEGHLGAYRPAAPTPRERTAPTRVDATLSIVSGAGQADSIDAILPMPVVVVVQDTFGRPAAHVAVDWGTAGDCPDACFVSALYTVPVGGTPTVLVQVAPSDSSASQPRWSQDGQRISVGSALSRAALGAFVRAAREIREQGTFGFAAEALTYADANDLVAER
jgi:hypothetical protein